MLKTALAATGIALTFGFNANTLAYDFEIRQQLKYKDYPSEWRTKYKKSGAIKEHDWREKQELQSKTQLFISKQIAAQHFRYQLRLGYKFEEQNDQHIEYKPNGDFKNSKTRHEYQRNSYIGLGFQQRWFQLLGADLISLSGYYDHYYQIGYAAKPKGNKSKDYYGDGRAREVELILSGEYSTPAPQLYLIPKLEYRYRKFGGWQDELNDDHQAAAKENRRRASLWLNWVTPLPGLELYTGPTWRHEREAEQKDSNWLWQRGNSRQWDLKLEYEAASSGWEMEFKYSRYYDGLDKHQNRYKFELSYEF